VQEYDDLTARVPGQVHVDHRVVVVGVAEHRVREQVHDGHASDPGGRSRVRAMTKWEYLTAPVLVHSTKQILDNFGSDGWELVQVVPGMNPENLVAYFKRPVE
jgi:hypothetical protein